MREDARRDAVVIGAAAGLLAGVVAALLSLPGCGPGGADGAGAAPPVRVRLLTGLGTIDLEVDAAGAPVTAANFLRYVAAGHYDGGLFHRTVRSDNQPDNDIRIEVVQAGVSPARAGDDFEPIPLERTSSTGLRHVDGTVSMARDGPDTATSDFFICIGTQAELDFGGRRNPDGQGFAAFGRVVRGMDVVRAIQSQPARGQVLEPPILIRRAVRLPQSETD